jgi:hypothetical protein
MGYQTIPTTNTKYALIAFDENGVEQPEGGRLFSEALAETVKQEHFSNIFFFCHGWKGDIPAAIEQYDRWIKALLDSTDCTSAEEVFPSFKPLLIGLHWPSLPFGDEEMRDAGNFTVGGPGPAALFQAYISRLGDRPEIREPLTAIFEEAKRNVSPDSMPEAIRDAYRTLNEALGLGASGPGAPPDADREEFDPEQAYQQAQDRGQDFAGFSLGGLLSPLRQLSYWTMKKRARTVGEGGMHEFLKKLQRNAPSTRIHLMGHSFGTIVISGMVGGPGGAGVLERPIDSVALVQGAVSLWSYSASIPFPNAGPGYFSKNLDPRRIRGPLVVTRSKHDRAVGILYPLASNVKDGSSAFAVGGFPEYGAMGAFGLQGLGELQHNLTMLPASQKYQFAPGKAYNLESSGFIAKGGGFSGAHSDIDGPEVAHALWEAAFASVGA